MLDIKKKQQIIKKFQTHNEDTGSSDVQIAILTAEIDELIEHLKTHPNDHSSRRGLLRKVSARRRLIRFLKKEDPKSYEKLIEKLKIKQPRVIVKMDGAAEMKIEDEDISDIGLTENGNDKDNG